MKIFKEIIVKRNNMFILDSKDYQVLSMLYKPIIGFEALNIYSTLYMLSLNNEKINSMLLFKDMTADDSINDEKISAYFDMLSKVKLIQIIEDVVNLYAPYNGVDFFNTKLGEYLSVFVSRVHLNLLMERFLGKIIEIKSPKNDDLNDLSNELNVFIKKTSTIPFDFNLFKSTVSNLRKVREEDKDFFSSIACLYSFSLQDVVSIFYSGIYGDSYDKNAMINIAYRKYLRKQKKKTDDEIIEYFNKTKPENIIEFGSNRISIADKNTVTKMREELKLSDPMISLLISYSLSTNSNKMHTLAFYKKIVNDWNEKGILTVEEAFLYINSLYYKKSDDEWFDELWNKNKEEINKWLIQAIYLWSIL